MICSVSCHVWMGYGSSGKCVECCVSTRGHDLDHLLCYQTSSKFSSHYNLVNGIALIQTYDLKIADLTYHWIGVDLKLRLTFIGIKSHLFGSDTQHGNLGYVWTVVCPDTHVYAGLSLLVCVCVCQSVCEWRGDAMRNVWRFYCL